MKNDTTSAIPRWHYGRHPHIRTRVPLRVSPLGHRVLTIFVFTKHFGSPTPEEKRAFTRVLQGHIAIDVAVFPNGTTGYILCVL